MGNLLGDLNSSIVEHLQAGQNNDPANGQEAGNQGTADQKPPENNAPEADANANAEDKGNSPDKSGDEGNGSDKKDGQGNEPTDDDFKQVGKFVPYKRFQEKVKEVEDLRVKLAEADAGIKAKAKEEGYDPEDQSALEELKKLGYIRKEEADKLILEKELEKKQEEQKAEWLNMVKALETKYDGKNGLPQFKIEELSQFMESNSIYDLEGAYILSNLTKFIDLKAQQLAKQMQGVPAGK